MLLTWRKSRNFPKEAPLWCLGLGVCAPKYCNSRDRMSKTYPLRSKVTLHLANMSNKKLADLVTPPSWLPWTDMASSSSSNVLRVT